MSFFLARRAVLAVISGGLVVFLSTGGVLAQQFNFTGVVYSGAPPDVGHPLPGVTVSLYGDTDEWPENGPRVLLAEAVSSPQGAFSLAWQGPSRLYPYFHVQETDPGGANSTGAVAAPPGRVKNLNTISYLAPAPGTYSGIAFWDVLTLGPPSPGLGVSLADLSVSDLTVEPFAPAEGEPLAVRVVLRNTGAAPAPPFDVTLRIDEGGDPLRISFEGFAAGEETAVRWEIPGLPPGPHRLLIEVDPARRIHEQREENNVVSIEIEVRMGYRGAEAPLLPDLEFVAIDVVPRTVQPGGVATVIVTLTNVGTAAAGPGLLVLRTDAEQHVAEAPLPGLAPGGRADVHCVVVFLEEAEVTLVALLDPADEIPELDEENNSGRAALWVEKETLPDLAILGSSLLTPLSPFLPWIVSLTLENKGGAPAGAFVISLGQGGTAASPPLVVNGLLPGASVDVSLFAPSPTPAEPLVVAIDSENWVKESDEESNALSLSFEPPSLPDLSVTSLTLSVAEPQVGVPVWISVRVTNEGSVAVEDANVFIVVVDPAVLAAGDQEGPWLEFAAPIVLSALDAGGGAMLSVEWTPMVAGTFVVRVVADSTGTLWETDETNNAADLSLTVQGG
ncbi:MAG: CARDB domain-containing protein [Candidatus Bipolaricaulis sp.]|nr:CARDB domain-containing protein [Candidatus Bipolaricaulis sp.]